MELKKLEADAISTEIVFVAIYLSFFFSHTHIESRATKTKATLKQAAPAVAAAAVPAVAAPAAAAAAAADDDDDDIDLFDFGKHIIECFAICDFGSTIMCQSCLSISNIFFDLIFVSIFQNSLSKICV